MLRHSRHSKFYLPVHATATFKHCGASARRKSFRDSFGGRSRFLRRERSDDFFEARIAAERIPEGHQPEGAVTQHLRRAGSTQSSFQLLQGKLLFARPRCCNGEILKDETAVLDIFFHRHERDRSAALFQGQVFVPQSSVDHSEVAERRPIVWLRLHNLFLLRASGFKSSVCACLVSYHARQQSFTKAAAQLDRVFAPRGNVAERDERSFGRCRIAFGQRALEPDIRRGSNGARSLCQNCINRLVERMSVSFPVEFKCCEIRPSFDVVGHDAERPIPRSNPLAITPEPLITDRDLLQSKKVTRIKLHRAL